jgi:hypothetical protein
MNEAPGQFPPLPEPPPPSWQSAGPPASGAAGPPPAISYPLSVGRIFQLGWSIFRFGWLRLLGIAFICMIPAYVVLVYVSAAYSPALNAWVDEADAAIANGLTPPPLPAEVAGTLLPLVGATVLLLVAGILAASATIHMADAIFRGERPSVRHSLGEAFMRLPALIGAQLIYLLIAVVILVVGVGFGGGLLSFGGALAFIGLIAIVAAFAAVIFVAIRVSLVQQAIMLERVGAILGLGRSWRVATGAGWRIIGYLILISIISGLLGIVFSGIPAAVLRLDPNSFVGIAIGTVIDGLANILVVPMVPIVFNLLYYDLRSRRGEVPVPGVEGSVPEQHP